MEWQKEVESLKKARNWWKPIAGQHKVRFLSDGEEYETEWEGKIIPKVRFDIKINNEELSWGVTKGSTKNSLYGQLALIGRAKGTLVNEEITLIVKGKDKDTDYTVLESLDLMDDGTKEEVVN